MKKLFICLFSMLLFSSVAFAGDLQWIIPFGPGGSSATMAPSIIDGMKEKGWNVDVVFTGDCASARHAIQSADGPVMYTWMEIWGPDSECYMDTKDEFTTFFAIKDLMLCGGLDNKTDIFETSEESVTVGIRPSSEFLPEWQDMVQAATKTNIRFINFPNGGTTRAAVAAGELDYILSGDGTRLMANDQATCFYHTGNYDSATMKPLQDKVPSLPFLEETMGIYLKDIPANIDEKLTADVRDVLLHNEELAKVRTKNGSYTRE